jgi:TetR/AcrR family transcriptional repressor of nem operon
MMARTSRAEKARTRQRLVATASREFRAQGVAGTSIPRVMEQVGLTQGTFYAHFASKDALMAEAVGAGLAEVVDGLLGAPADAAPTHELSTVIARYLNAAHRDDAAGGCVLPALAGEIPREPEVVRRVFTEELGRFFTRLAPLMPAAVADTREDQGMALIAGMAGAILLARAVDDPAMSDRILRVSREFYADALAHQSQTGTPSVREEEMEGS